MTKGRALVRGRGKIRYQCGLVMLLVAAAWLGAAAPAEATTQYFSGYGQPGTWYENSGFSGWDYNEAINCLERPCDSYVGVRQKLSDGTWIRTYYGLANIDICAAQVYSKTLCGDADSFHFSITCFRDNSGSC